MGRRSADNSRPWGWLTGIRPAKLMSRLLNEMDEAEAFVQMQKLYEVSPERASLCLHAAKAGARVSVKPEDTALYVGIPFCPSRCSYCSFVSGWVGKTGKLMAPFTDMLEYELEQTANTIETLGLNTTAVYIGGGTPTCLPQPLFERVLELVRKYIPSQNVREYTVEAGRPDTITGENTAAMLAYGVDRVSVNPQSMNAATLEKIGRLHTVEDVCKAFELVNGFKTVNMDIIAGLPGETAEDFEHTLSEVIRLAPQNITVHTLARKKGSDISGGADGDPAEAAAMIEHSLKTLPRAGYRPYYLYRQKFMAADFENIGWSLEGHDGYYNIIMMAELATVLAAGGGGVTKLVNQKTGLIERAYNVKYPSEYNNSKLKIDLKQQFVIDFYRRANI